MSRALSLCGVVLAAGASTRMGTDKALLPWSSSTLPGAQGTFLSGAIRSLNSVTDLVIVVAGANASSLAPIVYVNAAFLVINSQAELGQFSSLQVGLQEVLNRGRDAAVVTLVDRPPVALATLATLRHEFDRTVDEGKWATVPEYAGKHGHPIFISREMIEAFLKAPVTSTAREIRHAHQSRTRYVVVNDPFVTMNVDTPQDYEALLSSNFR